MKGKMAKNDMNKQQEASRRFLGYHHFVEVIAFRTAPCRSLQEDIVQDVFIEFVTHAENFELSDDLCPLLARMTKITALRHWREYMRHSPEKIAKVAEELRVRMITVSDTATRETLNDRLAAMRICVGKLAEKSRKLLEAFYIRGNSFAMIAESTMQNEGTLRKAMCRIRGSLRECIEKILKNGSVS